MLMTKDSLRNRSLLAARGPMRVKYLLTNATFLISGSLLTSRRLDDLPFSNLNLFPVGSATR
jgi:hypothetical protein